VKHIIYQTGTAVSSHKELETFAGKARKFQLQSSTKWEAENKYGPLLTTRPSGKYYQGLLIYQKVAGYRSHLNFFVVLENSFGPDLSLDL
jgi:hypothetical protein